MTAGDAVLATASLVVYVTALVATIRSILSDPELTHREQFWGTLAVGALPVLGILMWIVVSPTQAWRIFAREKDASEG